MGNLWVSFPGEGPSVMLFTHMDQIGFVVRKIEENGFIKIERLGGVPEKSLASQAVIFPLENGNEIFGIITNKSHHATQQNEKYSVVPYKDLYIDVGVNSFEEVLNLGINIGSPVVYKPSAEEFGKERIAGTSIDDRAGCAIAIAIAEKLSLRKLGPPIHLVFSVQEEFNLRGVIPIAQQLFWGSAMGLTCGRQGVNGLPWRERLMDFMIGTLHISARGQKHNNIIPTQAKLTTKKEISAARPLAHGV